MTDPSNDDITAQGDYEDLTQMKLSEDDLDTLVGAGGECVFNWTNRQGYPVGVVVAYVHRSGVFWTTCAEHRKRVPALSARPQSAIIVNKNGRTATFKGDSTIHTSDDADWHETSSWFYDALAGVGAGRADAHTKSFRSLLDSPNRVIISTPVELVVGFDGHKFRAVTAAAIEAGLAEV